MPSELNAIFGRDAAHPFFDGSLDVRLKANSRTGVGVTIERLPIAETIWDTREEGKGADKRVLQVLDLGEFGHVEFELPTFSFKNGAFAASGSFAQRDLALPLKPLKRMLAGMGLGVAENLLPDKVDLEAIDLLSPDDKLDADAFMRLIDASDIDLPKETFQTAIDAIAGEVDRLPLAFRNYLKIVPPDELSFAIAFSMDGGIRFDVEAQGDKPLKLLMPGATPLPGLTGVTLRKATLGEILSGSLLLFGLDVEVDFFDRLPTPYGLVRGGVAPDHQNIKAVIRVYDKLARRDQLHFYGNVMIGRDLAIDELRRCYDQIVIAAGNESHRRMGIPGEDLRGVRTVAGDYNESQLADRMDRAKLIGDIVSHWHKYGERRRTVAFAVNVAHSIHLRDEFARAGVRAEHLDGSTPIAERTATLSKLGSGELEVVTKVSSAGFGADDVM